MHAYLIVTKDESRLTEEVKNQIDLTGYKIVEFALQKIEDARNFNAFVKLSLPEKTAIVVRNFHQATEECANSVLKKIEEPQENLIFIIHSKNENLVLPTIKSRCQIVRIRNFDTQNDLSEISSFIKMDLLEKSAYLSKMKERNEILNFCDNLVLFSSEQIKSDNFEKGIRYAKNALLLRKAINGNGNINLHFLHFLKNISN